MKLTKNQAWNLSEYLNTIAVANDWNYEDIKKHSGFSYGFLHTAMNGEKRYLKADTLPRLEKFTGMSISELLSGKWKALGDKSDKGVGQDSRLVEILESLPSEFDLLNKRIAYIEKGIQSLLSSNIDTPNGIGADTPLPNSTKAGILNLLRR